MPFTLWTKNNGKIIVDEFGKVYSCEECPCGGIFQRTDFYQWVCYNNSQNGYWQYVSTGQRLIEDAPYGDPLPKPFNHYETDYDWTTSFSVFTTIFGGTGGSIEIQEAYVNPFGDNPTLEEVDVQTLPYDIERHTEFPSWTDPYDPYDNDYVEIGCIYTSLPNKIHPTTTGAFYTVDESNYRKSDDTLISNTIYEYRLTDFNLDYGFLKRSGGPYNGLKSSDPIIIGWTGSAGVERRIYRSTTGTWTEWEGFAGGNSTFRIDFNPRTGIYEFELETTDDTFPIIEKGSLTGSYNFSETTTQEFFTSYRVTTENFSLSFSEGIPIEEPLIPTFVGANNEQGYTIVYPPDAYIMNGEDAYGNWWEVEITKSGGGYIGSGRAISWSEGTLLISGEETEPLYDPEWTDTTFDYPYPPDATPIISTATVSMTQDTNTGDWNVSVNVGGRAHTLRRASDGIILSSGGSSDFKFSLF